MVEANGHVQPGEYDRVGVNVDRRLRSSGGLRGAEAASNRGAARAVTRSGGDAQARSEPGDGGDCYDNAMGESFFTT